MEESLLLRLLRNSRTLIGVGILLIASSLFFHAFDLGFIFSPHVENQRIRILPGASARDIAETLFHEGVIRSRGDFLLYAKLTRRDRTLHSGVFVFDGAYAVPKVLDMFAGNGGAVRVTLIEGWTNMEMGIALERAGIFSRDAFLAFARGSEGMLFPDTYEFSPDSSPEEVVALLRANFESKFSELKSEIAESKKSERDIIIMASIVEREGLSSEDRPIIAGILWKRLALGMRLQADATLTYLTGKSSEELTAQDLAIDSPFNTYRYDGLPPSPIGNPGREALEAAIRPSDSPYLFYLHDADGGAHYARTFEEHKQNKLKYLR